MENCKHTFALPCIIYQSDIKYNSFTKISHAFLSVECSITTNALAPIACTTLFLKIFILF